MGITKLDKAIHRVRRSPDIGDPIIMTGKAKGKDDEICFF